MRNYFLSTIFILISSCSGNFATTDITELIQNKSAAFIVDSSEHYSTHGGYGSSCAHPGAHVIFDGDSVPRNVYAVSDGVVARIDKCETAGENNKYNILLSLGIVGATPVYMEYSIEPFNGKPCDSNEDFFANEILVEEGEVVKKGQKIATITPATNDAHIHFSLIADGAKICPDIFPASDFDENTIGTIQDAGCLESATSLCFELTDSEKPTNLIE